MVYQDRPSFAKTCKTSCSMQGLHDYGCPKVSAKAQPLGLDSLEALSRRSWLCSELGLANAVVHRVVGVWMAPLMLCS